MTMTSPAPTLDLSRRRILLIIGALLPGLFLAALDQTINATALPTIVGDLHGASDLGGDRISVGLHCLDAVVAQARGSDSSFERWPSSVTKARSRLVRMISATTTSEAMK